MSNFDQIFENLKDETGKPLTLGAIKKLYTGFILAKANGKITKASQILGINRRTFYRRRAKDTNENNPTTN